MRRLGLHNFTMEVLEECDYTELNEKEKRYIEQYDSYNNGYNSTLGGDALQPRLIKYATNIIELYINGLSSMEISKIYNCSDETILNLLKREDVPIRTLSQEILAIELDLVFSSYYDAARYIIDNGFTHSKSVPDVARNISNACKTMTHAYKISFAHLNDILNGTYEYGKYKNNSIHIKPKNNTCSICNKPITAQAVTGMCNSCANVVAKGKSPKPSKEELKQLLDKGLQKKQIAEMYERTKSTVAYWIKSYNL